MKTKSIYWLAAVFFVLPIVRTGAQEELPLVKPEVKTLAVFKNGLGFVFKSADAKLKQGWGRMDDLPPATLGSLWIGTTAKGATVTDVLSYKQQLAETHEAVTLPEMLAANVGKRVGVNYSVGNTQMHAEGTLVSVPADRKPDELAGTSPSGYVPGRAMPDQTRGEVVLIRTGAANGPVVAVNKYSIQSVEFLDAPELTSKADKTHSGVKFHVSGDPASADVTVACLEKGIIWTPSYRVNIADETKAQIMLDAVLADDAEDLTNVEVSLVVGYPNFMYADMVSPMSPQESVAAFVQSLLSASRNPGGLSFANGNFMAQSVAYNTAAYDPGSRVQDLYSTGQPLPGQSNEDLYFYHKTRVTLKKGERARYEVFSATVPYEHAYQWDVADDQNIDTRSFARNAGDMPRNPENQVWHVLRLENKTKQPWTTAPAFTVNDAMPVAQDVLGYTPPGVKSTLKLTIATDIRAEATQTEEQRRSVTTSGYPMDEITVNGKLKVTSLKTNEVSMVVRKNITGEVLDAGTGKVIKVARALSAINPTSAVTWEFKLAGGKDQELTYQYKVMVRR